MAKKKNAPAAEAPTTTNEATPLIDANPPVESAREKPTKKKRSKSDATLADVFASYVEAMENDGKSGGTIASYKMELALAVDEMGVDTKIADLTPERVVIYFGCDRLVKTRSGRAKSPLSIAKSQRVLRQALQHAEAVGLVAKAPLPELAASH